MAESHILSRKASVGLTLTARRSFPLRCGLAVGIAFCWTTNHLLSLDEAAWPEMYRSRRAVASIGPLCLRLLTWVAGSFSIHEHSGWQLWGMRRLDAKRDSSLLVANWMALHSIDERRLPLMRKSLRAAVPNSPSDRRIQKNDKKSGKPSLTCRYMAIY